MSNIEWSFCDNNVSKEKITKNADEWGIAFPDDYICCAMENHGGCPDKEELLVDGIEKVLGNLLSFDEESDDNILELFSDIRNRLPEKIFPFAIDPAGNYICFDYRNDNMKPVIVFWDHEAAYLKSDFPNKKWEDGEFEELRAKSIIRISGSFTEFLDSLY